jgi:hypothetical protein
MRRNLFADFMVGNLSARWMSGDQRERDAVRREIEDAPGDVRSVLLGQVDAKLERLGAAAGRAAFYQNVVLPLMREPR